MKKGALLSPQTTEADLAYELGILMVFDGIGPLKILFETQSSFRVRTGVHYGPVSF
jgi:hypothetical protein